MNDQRERLPGLFTGFESFRIPSSAEVDDAIRDGLVAVDTNVLLNAYRYIPATVDDLLTLLRKLDDRLFVPHQVVREFWRNRRAVLGNPASNRKDAVEALQKNEKSTRDAIDRWAKVVALDPHERSGLHEVVGGAFSQLIRRVEEGAPSAVSAETPTAEDPTLRELASVLDKRVGGKPADDIWAAAIEEGTRRVLANEPPGFEDDDKLDSDYPEKASGDYLVWSQLLSEAKSRDKDLVLVTGDVKDDWWEKYRGRAIGPRQELIEEFHEVVGRRVFFIEPNDFLRRGAVLNVTVRPESVEDVERVRDQVAESSPWAPEAIDAVLSWLDREGRVQSTVIREAAQNGGRITRDRVYELDGRGDEAMLRGFTRPVKRMTTELQLDGLVPLGVPDMLRAVYETGVKASHFAIPDEVVSHLSVRLE